MNPERWKQVEQLYWSALNREPGERDAFLFEACKNDDELRRNVEDLLAQGSGALNDVFSRVDAGFAEEQSTATLHYRLSIGQSVGPYRVQALLGVGGMGQVFQALDVRLGRRVAIKVSAEPFSARFEREARAISALNHPHVCTLYDVGSLPDGSRFLVTELVEGETLRGWLDRVPHAERGVDAVRDIARQVLEALRAAHRAGIVHRDLKPANIMIRFDGYVKVLDFGLAKRFPVSGLLGNENATADLSLRGGMIGTIAYMSPEQIQGQDTGPRSDLFAVGIILHEMLTGEHPWRRRSSVETLHAILHDGPPPIPEAASSGFATIVQTLLRKVPADRFGSAESVLEALARRTDPQAALSADNVSRVRALTSIAVLPFVFLSDVEEHKALSLGFADALITMLGKLGDVAVTPTSAILKFGGAEPDQVFRSLGVRYVLQGSVQKLGAQWRVSIQLFDTTAQKIAFSEKYDFKLENVFDVQDEIGRRVVGSLESRFSLSPARVHERYSSDPEAYGEFMAGLRESTSDLREDMERSVRHLSKAVEHDPDFALAHGTLSYMYTNLYFRDPQRIWIENAEHHCDRALALDPGLPEGNLARAWILWSPEKNFQHAAAIAALEGVIEAQPNFERAHNRMSAICWHIGRMEEARLAHEAARRSNPKTKTQNLENIHLYSGDFALAAEDAKRWVLEGNRNFYAFDFLVYSAIVNDDLDLANEHLREGLSHVPNDPLLLSLRGLWHARRNDASAAVEWIRKALDSPLSLAHIHHAYHQIAGVYAILGDTEKAMAWLVRAVDTGFPCWSFFRIDPHFENLRGLNSFQILLEGLEKKYMALKITRL